MEKLLSVEMSLKFFLKHVNIHEFQYKVNQFRKINLKYINDKKLSEAITKVLVFKTSNGNELRFPTNIKRYKAGTKFYRVRKLESSDQRFPLNGMKVEQDAWNPPEHVVNVRGRLNKIKESLLYVAAGSPEVALREAKVTDNDHFSLIVYHAKEEIKVNMIGLFEHNNNLNFEENLKLKLIMNFLKEEFSREVGDGKEYLYRVSEMIAKDYFDLPPRVAQDAWCYPSIASKGSVNACFRPELGRELLQLQGVIICELVQQDIKCKMIAHGFDNNGYFVYHPIGSDIQKVVFPEIIKT